MFRVLKPIIMDISIMIMIILIMNEKKKMIDHVYEVYEIDNIDLVVVVAGLGGCELPYSLVRSGHSLTGQSSKYPITQTLHQVNLFELICLAI